MEIEMEMEMEKKPTEPKCPACNDTGDCFRKKSNGNRYWYPCPVCNNCKWDKPDMERYKRWKKENK